MYVYIPNNIMHSANDCTCIPTAWFWGSLKFYSLLKCTVAWGLFIWRDVPLGCLINLPCSLCLSQRSQPEGGAALSQWEGRSHAESPELFHPESTPQGLLPGRAQSPMCACVSQVKSSEGEITANSLSQRRKPSHFQHNIQQEVLPGLRMWWLLDSAS